MGMVGSAGVRTGAGGSLSDGMLPGAILTASTRPNGSGMFNRKNLTGVCLSIARPARTA